jgi:dephospho-CoA kinase
MDEKRKFGRVVIDNSGNMAELAAQVELICCRELGVSGKIKAGD